MRTRARGWAVGLAAASLLVAGCSSGGSSKPSTSLPAKVSKAPVSTHSLGPASAVPAAPSAGCNAPKANPGETKQTLSAAGVSGWYFRHIPPTYTGAKPMPLILDLHGYGEAAEIHTQISGLGRYGDTHGFLTLSLLPTFMTNAFEIRNVTMGVNYGMNKVRFVQPVPVDSRLRAHFKVQSWEAIGDNGAQITYEMTVEIEGASKPVSHMSRTITNLNGSVGFLKRVSMRLRTSFG